MVRLACELGPRLGIGLSEWVPISKKIEELEIPSSQVTNIAELAEIVSGGNWMWAVARGVENNKPFKIYCFATNTGGKWVFDTHIGDDLTEPCFGLTVPFLYIPMWRIFSSVYIECKKLYGLPDKITLGG
jgi:hypothetical protein